MFALFAFWLLLLTLGITPRQSFPIQPGDPRLGEPYERAAIPGWAKALLTVALPYGVMWAALLVHKIRQDSARVNWLDAHNMSLGFVASLIAQAALVLVLQLVTGQPRPNYFANPNKMRDALMTFPSAAASMAFAAWTFALFYCAGKFGSFHTTMSAPLWRTLLTLMLFVPAALVAISVRLDHHNHWVDIAVGALLGAELATVIYSTFFYGVTVDSVSALPKRRKLPAHLRNNGGGGGTTTTTTTQHASVGSTSSKAAALHRSSVVGGAE